METDKALVEVPSPREGVIKTLHGSEGEILNVGNPLVTYEGGDEAHPNRQQAVLATEETSSGHMGATRPPTASARTRAPSSARSATRRPGSGRATARRSPPRPCAASRATWASTSTPCRARASRGA
jgi:pyruvate/2-oxoglutarate dehydrogenase complex dihydrolipoamide acyltransferase (E2) component